MTLALVACSSFASANEDPLKSIEISGFVDVYYGFSFNDPPSGDTLAFRQFDVRHSGFSLAMAQVSLAKKAELGKIGFRIDLSAGKNADIINALEPGGKSRYKPIHQAYASWQATDGLTVDFGKFLTWIGYEGSASADNDNYSRSLLFFGGQPLYHAGLRATGSSGGLGYGVFVVNGWNEVEDSNGSPTFGLSLSGNPAKNFFVALNGLMGSEGSNSTNPAGSFGGIGFGTAGQSTVSMADLVLTYQATDKLKLAANVDYATADGSSGSADGEWYGAALYAKYQATDKVALGSRWETFSDPDGLRTGMDSLLNSITANLDYAPQSDLLFRLEYRHDSANRSFFPKSSGTKKSQSSITLSAVFKF